ncbi:MAG TPA: hypothetical protein VJU61_27900, partial [Polyangiaceae bacterium]|nr:hypothetical protein [Polyangiaceae bacterium]
DGVLHAFNLEDWKDKAGATHKGGDELWGFIPPTLFGKMHSMLAGHQYMFDGTPMVQDVMLQHRRDTAPIFRTVLLAAVRGAPAFVALDVTFPEKPVFLWQAAFSGLGDTIANPGLTQVDVDWEGEKQTRAVAILPGGKGERRDGECLGGEPIKDNETRAQFPEGNRRNVRCWDQVGRSLYVVDVATGHLIQEFGPEHFPSPLTGSVVVDGVGIGRSTAAYFFDEDGVLWRLSMLHSDPSFWSAQPIYDMFADPIAGTVDPQPTWNAGRSPKYAPTLTLNRQGNLVILAGTGDVDSPIDSARQRVVSLTEYRDAGLSSTQIAGTVLLNWKIDLVENEGVTGPLTVVNDIAYFASFESFAGTDQCALGRSRIYGVHAFEREPVTGVTDPASWPAVPKPELIATNALPSAPRVPYEDFDQGGTNLLIGLTVKRQPICQSQSLALNSIYGKNMSSTPPSGGLYQLSGVLGGGSTGGATKAGSLIGELPFNQSLQDRRNHTVSTWASFAD